MNILIQVFVWTYIFIFLGKIPMSGIAHMISVCQTWYEIANCFTNCFMNCSIVNSPQQCYESSSYPTPLSTFVIISLASLVSV